MPTVPLLTLVETVVHEVPRGRSKDGGPTVVLSGAPTVLTTATDRFIREEMLQPALASGREIVEESSSSPVPGLLRAVLQDELLLVENSAQMAIHLHKTQPGGASAGVFLCARVRYDNGDRIVLMKAEHNQGMRLQQIVGEDGQVTFRAEHLNELILGRKAQVYKIGMFWLSESGKLTGLMVDRQNGVGYAEYFLEYLGFALVHPAEKLVADFTNAITKHINLASYSPEKKTRYLEALAAVLESPSPTLRPTSFITDFIDPEDRHDVAAMMPAQVANLDFRKDTTLVRHLIGGLKLRTQSGVTVTADNAAVAAGMVEVHDDKIVVNEAATDFKLGRGRT